MYHWKSEILKFWGQPKIRKSLSVDITDNRVVIDKKDYKMPIFIELTDELDSALLFGFDGTIAQHLQKIKSTKKFLMVDECRDIKTSGQLISDNGMAMANDGWCLVTGKGKEYIFKTKLKSDVQYSRTELKNIMGI